LLPLAAADAPAAAEESPPLAVAAEKSAPEKGVSARERAKWRVDNGARLHLDDIPTMGQHMLCEFLRAHGRSGDARNEH